MTHLNTVINLFVFVKSLYVYPIKYIHLILYTVYSYKIHVLHTERTLTQPVCIAIGDNKLYT